MIGNLELYRIFHVVSRNNSISKAAQELYMTQSAVSQAIIRLEKEIELQLFYRTSKGVVLTNEGRILNEHVNSALGIIDVAEDKLLEYKTLKTGQLRIGVGDTITRHFLLSYIERFHLNYPEVKLNMLNGTTNEICGYIKSGKADVGICNLPIQDKQLEIIPCKQIQDIFVCGDKYKSLTNKPISLEYLMELPLIFLEKKSNSRMFIENFFNKKGYQLSPKFELGSYDLVLECAKRNLGISCVIKEFSYDYIESGTLYEIRLDEDIPKRNIGITYLKNIPLSHAARKFVESIHDKI